jgi:hypothetical protein
VGVSSPHSFSAWWEALRIFSFCFHARIASLWAQFATRLDTSSGRLMPHSTLWAPPKTLHKVANVMKR